MKDCIYLDTHPMTSTLILCTNPEALADKGTFICEKVCIGDFQCPHYKAKPEDVIFVPPGTEPIKNDAVNHPNHYTQGGIECIEAIKAAMPPEGFQDYCKGNVMKYIWRWRDKAGVEDLKKARVYLNWLIESAVKEDEHA